MKIFSFPVLIHDEIVKQLGTAELFSLSLCSKKAHTFVKYYAKIKKVEFHGDLSRYGLYFPGRQPIMIWAEEGLNLEVLNLESLRLNLETPILNTHGRFKMLVEPFRDVCTYWEDAEKGCQELVTYICDLFKVSIFTVDIRPSGVKVLDSIQKGQKQKLKNVTIVGSDISADDYSIIMRCNATEMLKVRSMAPRGYRFEGTLPPVRTLHIRNAFWVTREHLLGLQSQNVILCCSELTTMDVSALLRFWLSGGLPNLKYLNLNARRFMLEVDLRARMEIVQETLSYKWKHDKNAVELRLPAFHIRREDGTVATIKIDNDSCLTMVVWPDVNNQHV